MGSFKLSPIFRWICEGGRKGPHNAHNLVSCESLRVGEANGNIYITLNEGLTFQKREEIAYIVGTAVSKGPLRRHTRRCNSPDGKRAKHEASGLTFAPVGSTLTALLPKRASILQMWKAGIPCAWKSCPAERYTCLPFPTVVTKCTLFV